jgi:excisionase family DNA binding protein
MTEGHDSRQLVHPWNNNRPAVSHPTPFFSDPILLSRPFVIKLIKRGELPCRLVGTHRRIPTPALVAYREKMFQQAKKAADEMAQLSQDLGLYQSEGPAPQGQ